MRVGGHMTYEGGKSDPPPSPDYSAVMEKEMAFRQKQYDETRPLIERSIASGEKANDRMMQMMEENVARQKEQYERQQKAFAPTELQVAADAYGQQYLSDDEKAQLFEAIDPSTELSETDRYKRLSAINTIAEKRAADEAMGTTRAAVNQAYGQQGRMLGRFAMNPAKMEEIARRNAGAHALQLAGASNMARQGVRDRSVGMHANLANMGRGFINTSAQLGGLATTQGQAALSALGQGIGNVNAGSSSMTQGYQNQQQSLQREFDSGMQSWKAGAEQDAALMKGIGQMGGMAMGMMAGSSKDIKTGRRAVDDDEVLEGMKRVPVESWNYKNGGGRHIGPMAEDVNREMGDEVAPGGKVLDVVSTMGAHHAAIRALSDKIDELQHARRGSYRPQNYRHGGMIRGPGSGTSDSVRAINTSNGQPVRVSNGEYVLPADTVRHIGKQALDHIVRKTHAPVRRAMR
jgi:hypothetical protein